MRVQSPAPASLSSLIIDIEQSHHVFTRSQLDRIEEILDKVGSETLPETLEQCFKALKDDLMPHLIKEERILFPYITALESDPEHPPSSCFGSIANPIRMMQFEHDAVKSLLAEIRNLTMDYQPGHDASAGLAKFYAALKALDDDLVEHIYWEDNVLFPPRVAVGTGDSDLMPGVAPDSNPFLARWTAKGSNLCLGHWEISYLGSPLQLKPKIKQNDMGTYAIYCFFDPDD
ncbi:MAG TPA: hemerythrin domain-containing protein, partial [Methylophilaceae bacterium]|nr:hemerythrin domain-containing protein [Methylophilaceae bacterium]